MSPNRPASAISASGLDGVEALVADAIEAARIPGAAIAVVQEGRILLAAGFGVRDVVRRMPVTAHTIYPIASTTKGMTALLIATLVEEGILDWDEPVRGYLPSFRLSDPYVGGQVSLRDLLAMRTGLPRHDWVMLESGVSRSGLMERLPHLDLSAGLRERYQYNNLTYIAAAHVAEVVSGRGWEELLHARIFEALEMNATRFTVPVEGDFTQAFHQHSSTAEIRPTHPLWSSACGPAGGSVHSTVLDMVKWLSFNMGGGISGGRRLVRPETLAELHKAHIYVKPSPGARKQRAAYGLGWTVDRYCGHARLSHGGFIHDINSEVTLFPEQRLGIVSFVNRGETMFALPLNDCIAKLLFGEDPAPVLDSALGQLERDEPVKAGAKPRPLFPSASPNRLEDYAGVYCHAGYGDIRIEEAGPTLKLTRGRLELHLEHLHHDWWSASSYDLSSLAALDIEGALDLRFETGRDGGIEAISVALEPAVPPISFIRRRSVGASGTPQIGEAAS